MTAYYNEHDPFAAAWLRELIRCGQIAPGDVDERSIEDVKPDDLRPYTQCHFFAGIGVWSLALRRAGWDDARPIWTGSCPCQPFSAAGKGNGFADERHLWPAFFHLITQCGPSVVIGEQVASKDGLAWLDLVQTDMEAARYAFGALDLCAAGFGAPHIRQRSWWVALANARGAGVRGRRKYRNDVGETSDLRGEAWEQRWPEPSERGVTRGCGADRLAVVGQPSGLEQRAEQFGDTSQSGQRAPFGDDAGRCDGSSFLAEVVGQGPQGRAELTIPGEGRRNERDGAGRSGARLASRMAVPDGGDGSERDVQRSGQHGFEPQDPSASDANYRPGPTNGFWSDVDWLFCTDGKWRPVEPGTFPLVNGDPNRVGTLRGYGNAIAAPVAQGFIEAVMGHLQL